MSEDSTGNTVHTTKQGKKIRLPEGWQKLLVAVVTVVAAGGTLDQIRLGQVNDQFDQIQETKSNILNDTDMLETHLEVIRQRLVTLESVLSETKDHQHLWGSWSDPVPMQGRYTTPVYAQQRHCKLCNIAEIKH